MQDRTKTSHFGKFLQIRRFLQDSNEMDLICKNLAGNELFCRNLRRFMFFARICKNLQESCMICISAPSGFPQKEFKGESLLIVMFDSTNTLYNVATLLASTFDYSFIHRAEKRDDSAGNDFDWDLLPFTGVQYHTVVIIVDDLGENRRKSDCTANTE